MDDKRTVRWALSSQKETARRIVRFTVEPSGGLSRVRAEPARQTVRFTVRPSDGRSQVRTEVFYRTVRLTTGPSSGSTLEGTD